MKKIAEKVALVAQICIALVFVLTTGLYMAGIIPYNTIDTNGTSVQTEDGSIMMVLLTVLAILYLALSAFILYMNFSEREILNKILLFADSESATRTNMSVVNNIVGGCARRVEGIAVRKVKIRSDEKGGLVATLSVRVTAENVAQSVNTLRCLLFDSFKNTLGLTFNTINFDIEKLHGHYYPNEQRAEEMAMNLTEQQEETANNYEEPLPNNPETDVNSDEKTSALNEED